MPKLISKKVTKLASLNKPTNSNKPTSSNRPAKSLRRIFLEEMKGRSFFTLGEVVAWYVKHKGGVGPAYTANVYTLFIKPLLAEGLVAKGVRGLYYLNDASGAFGAFGNMERKKEEGCVEEDPFDRYLREKVS